MSIIILYGGKIKASNSEKNARAIYMDYADKNIHNKIRFCYVDIDGNIFESKIKTDIHKIFSHSDILIDTTHDYIGRDTHHKLARNLGLKILFANDLDTDNFRKTIFQVGVNHPEYNIVQKEDKNIRSTLYDMWRTMHMPIILKASKKSIPNLLTYNYQEAFEHINTSHAIGDDIILDTHTRGKKYTIIAIKNYRGEELYMTPIVETFDNIDNKNGYRKYISANFLSQTEKDIIQNEARKISDHILENLIKIDFVLDKNKNLKLVNASIKPDYHDGKITYSIFKDYGINISDILN